MNVMRWRKGSQAETIDAAALNREGTRLLTSGEAEKAENLFSQLVEQEPNKPPHYYNLGRSRLQQGQIDGAEKCFEKALGLNPESHLGLYGIAQIAEARQQWDEAIDGYQSLIAMQPNWIASVYRDLGAMLVKKKRWQEAIECYRQLIQLDDSNFLYYQVLGDTLLRAYQYIGAVESYQRAIELKPDSFWSHYQLGKVFFKLDKFEDSAAAFEKAHIVDSDRFDCYELAALSCEAVNLKERATDYWQRCFQKKPASALADVLRVSNDASEQLSSEQHKRFQTLIHKQSELDKENELLLVQLHQVQEELEAYFVQSEQQKSLLTKWTKTAEACGQKLRTMVEEPETQI